MARVREGAGAPPVAASTSAATRTPSRRSATGGDASRRRSASASPSASPSEDEARDDASASRSATTPNANASSSRAGAVASSSRARATTPSSASPANVRSVFGAALVAKATTSAKKKPPLSTTTPSSRDREATVSAKMAASSSKRAAYGDALRARWRRAAVLRAAAGDDKDKENATPSSSARAFDDANPAREVDAEDEWTNSSDDDDDDGSIHRRPRRWDGEVASADAALARGDLDVATKHLLTAIALARVQRTIASATTTTATTTTTTGAPPRRGMSPKTARAECALRTRLAEAYLDGADNAVDDDADELRDAAVAQLRAAVDAAAPCAASRAAPPATRRAMESARNDARLALVKALESRGERAEAAVVAREGLASLTSSEETTREDGSFDELHAEERLAALVTLCLHEADDALASAKASSRRLASVAREKRAVAAAIESDRAAMVKRTFKAHADPEAMYAASGAFATEAAARIAPVEARRKRREEETSRAYDEARATLDDARVRVAAHVARTADERDGVSSSGGGVRGVPARLLAQVLLRSTMAARGAKDWKTAAEHVDALLSLSDANDGGLPGTSHPRRARGPLLSERAELLARAGDCDAAIECAKAAVDAHELEAGVKGVSKASTRAARTLAFAHKKNGDEAAAARALEEAANKATRARVFEDDPTGMAELQSAWGAACVDAAGEATVYGDDASTEAGGPCLTAIVFLTRATECFGRAAELVGDAKGKASSEYAAATRRARASRRALADAMKLN